MVVNRWLKSCVVLYVGMRVVSLEKAVAVCLVLQTVEELDNQQVVKMVVKMVATPVVRRVLNMAAYSVT